MAKRFEDSDVLVWDDDTTECAWCLAHKGLPMGEGSHGICEAHAEIVRTKSQMRRIPSAVSKNATESKSRSLWR